MKVYYAHSLHLYNTPQEERDYLLLEDLGFSVINPNSFEIQQGIEEYKKEHGEENCMDFFRSLMDECDCLAFRAHIDGRIPSGVGYEIKYMRLAGKHVFELPTLTNNKFMEVEETRQYLQYNGQR